MFCQAECNGEKKGTDPFKVEPTRSSCYFLCRLGLFTESTSMHWALTLQDLCEALWAALCVCPTMGPGAEVYTVGSSRVPHT